ncbi:hypothetical protein [Streptomyces sp. NBC_01637]|uniref:hypothetical protein n=1 Tax=unclassified Streptomyces TaxID=2593676 RepID=UPI00386D73D0|nr:hypothetical protein OH719_26035 [Streptomyces sp. NBC_01653]WTD89859.1 hypothetical protein OG891_20835 [Streptomyces sp. NBC_01637]
MSDIQKASQDAVEAARQSEQFAVILAAVTAAQQAQQQVTPCQHAQPVAQSGGGAAKWLAIGAGGSALLLAVAVSAIAVAISAVALTVCVLVLRSVWTEVRKR